MAPIAPTVLLLEDEPLISMDLEMTLEAEGFEVFTVMSCAEANLWLDRNSPDIAIVDIELRDGLCTEVAARLVEANIGFIVHTGEHRSFQIGTPFAQATWVGKPAAPGELVLAVRATIEGRPRLRHSHAWEPSASLIDK